MIISRRKVSRPLSSSFTRFGHRSSISRDAGLVRLHFVRILESWTAKPLHLAHTDRLLMLLALGTAANAQREHPDALQLASGWTKWAFYQNIFTLCLQIPLTIWLGARLGAVGVASVWLLVNGSYLLIMIPIMHRRLLRGEMARWYCQDVGLPLLAAVSITGLARLWQPGQEAPLLTLFRSVLSGLSQAWQACLVAPVNTSDGTSSN